ncbi:hypothetical protein [Vibrio anguillarum]
MAETSNYQMAIDLLCCHLGLSEDEAKQQLGIGRHHPRSNKYLTRNKH